MSSSAPLLWPFWLLICACAPKQTAGRPATPVSAAYMARLSLAGCYTLQFGEWQEPLDSLVPRMASDRPSFLPPKVVRLDTVSEYGHLRVLPAPDSGTGFDFGYWYPSGSGMILHWEPSGGRGMSWLTFKVRLGPSERGFSGTAQMSADVRRDRPFRPVTARRVACEG